MLKFENQVLFNSPFYFPVKETEYKQKGHVLGLAEIDGAGVICSVSSGVSTGEYP